MNDDKILSLLKRLEWSGDTHGDLGTCLECGNPEKSHASDCEMNAAIQHFEARTKAVRPQSDKAVRLREDK